MSNFFTTTAVKRPFQDFAPHLETGTKLGYGLKIYRGYADVAVAGAGTSYHLLDAETDTPIMLHPNCGVIGGSLKARSGTLASAGILTLGTQTAGGANIAISSMHSVTNVIQGVGITYGSLAGSVSYALIGGGFLFCYPTLFTNAAVTVADRVYVTLLCMNATP